MLKFMLQWYEKFPEFKSRDLFLTGESYAGLANQSQINFKFTFHIKRKKKIIIIYYILREKSML